MQKGFKKVVVPMVQANPGFTAQEYAESALQKGLCGSDSKNPVFSLATTLMKESREGRIPEIKAVKGSDKKLHYFPISYNQTQQAIVPKKDIAVTVILPPNIAKNVELLMKVGKFSNVNDALIWLVNEGMQAKQNELANIEKIAYQIETLKQSISI